MPILNMRLTAPSVLIDINPVADLAGIAVEGNTLRIGAMTRHHEVAASAPVLKHAPLLSEAMRHVAHAAIRNRGTFGGSVAMADPAAELPACCVALEARMLIESVRARRTVGADRFFKGIFETALEPDELLVAVEFSVCGAPWRWAFDELARRHGDYALVGAAAQARLEGRRLAELRLVLFGVGDRPIRARAAEQALTGAAEAVDGIACAQAALSLDLSPASDTHASAETRLHLARVLVARLIRRLNEQA